MKLYKVSEIAEFFQVAERTIYNWIEFGYLRAIKVGEGRGTIRVPEDALKEFCQKNQTIIETFPPKRKLKLIVKKRNF